MIDLNDIADLREGGTARKLQPCGAGPPHTGHAMPGFKIDQQKGDCRDDGCTRTERNVQRNDHPARSQGAKLDWPTPVSVDFIVHRIRVSICNS